VEKAKLDGSFTGAMGIQILDKQAKFIMASGSFELLPIS
jgi:hypothetical protein